VHLASAAQYQLANKIIRQPTDRANPKMMASFPFIGIAIHAAISFGNLILQPPGPEMSVNF
jgi:hypothetical protein